MNHFVKERIDKLLQSWPSFWLINSLGVDTDDSGTGSPKGMLIFWLALRTLMGFQIVEIVVDEVTKEEHLIEYWEVYP
jgi:hypothetical protein